VNIVKYELSLLFTRGT